MERTRKKMDFEEILKKDHYWSIIELLKWYQNKEDRKGKTGLRARHFWYALMENAEPYREVKKTLEDFFREPGYPYNNIQRFPPWDEPTSHLEFLQKTNLVRKGCITTRQQLSNHLNFLHGRGIIKINGKTHVARYKLAKTYEELINKKSIKEWIEKWRYSDMLSDHSFYKLVDNQEYHNKRTVGSPLQERTQKSEYPEFSLLFSSSWFLCGFTSGFLKNLSQNEKEKFNQCMMVIEKKLEEIANLKFSKMNHIHRKWVNSKKEPNSDFYNEAIGFYYTGTKSLISNVRMKAVSDLFKNFPKKT